jgi:Na+-driven multidrug efflux pump
LRHSFALILGNLGAKGVGLALSVLFAAHLGKEGLGVLSLANSAYFLGLTLGGSGLSTVVSIVYSKHKSHGVLRRAFLVALLFSIPAMSVLFLLSSPVSMFMLKTTEVSSALKIAALSVPFVAISSCIKGFFYSENKLFPVPSAQIFEQLVRLLVIFLLFRFSFSFSPITKVFISVLAGEVFSTVYLSVFYLFHRVPRGLSSQKRYTSELLLLALPQSLVSSLTSVLRWAEDLLLLAGLTFFFGGVKSSALSFIGAFSGIVMPILFIPSPLFSGLLLLIVPKASELSSAGQMRRLSATASKLCGFCLAAGTMFAVFIICFGWEIIALLYPSAAGNAAVYLMSVAFISPLMYFEGGVTSILTGIGRQNQVLRISIYDCIIRVVLVIVLCPIFGEWGFVIMMWVSNLWTSAVNFRRLRAALSGGVRVSVMDSVLLPGVAAAVVCMGVKVLAGLV